MEPQILSILADFEEGQWVTILYAIQKWKHTYGDLTFVIEDK